MSDKDDPTLSCVPTAFGTLNVRLWNVGAVGQIVATPKLVVLLSETFHDYQLVPTDGRPHRDDQPPTYRGDAVGRWDGDTFVVDVTNFTDDTWMSAEGRVSFHSDALHIVERYRRVDAEHARDRGDRRGSEGADGPVDGAEADADARAVRRAAVAELCDRRSRRDDSQREPAPVGRRSAYAMRSITPLASALIACVVVGGAVAQQGVAPAADSDDVATLRAEIERLKSIMPGQAFAMTQVAYNFSNLWFAAHAENWPLAQFYFNETRVRLRWALRVTPVRKISTGDLELQPFLDALEKDPLAKLSEAVSAKNVAQLEAAYRATLEVATRAMPRAKRHTSSCKSLRSPRSR